MSSLNIENHVASMMDAADDFQRQRAFEEIYKSSIKELTAFAQEICGTTNHREVIQRCFLTFWKNLKKYIEKYEALIRGNIMIFLQRCIRLAQRSLRKEPAKRHDDFIAYEHDREDDQVASIEEIDNSIFQGITYNQLEDCLTQLQEDARYAIEAQVLDGMSIKEIAEALGIKIQSVKNMLSRAKKRVVACLNKRKP